jgi:glutamate/tyrosine decarboxylase-like PLP-dependent enzyme
VESTELRVRIAPLDMGADEFRALGHQLVDRIADFMAGLSNRPVTTGESVRTIRDVLGNKPLPEQGADAATLLDEAADLLFNHSLFNSHPRFMGYITSSAAPLGTLGELLAASVNPNVGAWALSPMATEIERQTIRWIAELMGYPSDCGGILVSGGNVANFVGFLAARKAKTNWDVRARGMKADESQSLCLYASTETHTWIHKAADLFGLGTDAIHWIPMDSDLRIDASALRQQIVEDKAQGYQPFLVIGTAGTTGTGAIDPLSELASICREHDLWFHVDAAYGGVATVVPQYADALRGLAEADSIAVDPHKWLYQPLEAGCALVRRPKAMLDAFSYHPSYYRFDDTEDEQPTNFYEYGLQNSRGFRALKVWLSLRQIGRAGYARMIADDIELARELYQLVAAHPALQAFTHSLSITTFRYVPPDLKPGTDNVETYLNQLNTELLNDIQTGGEAFISNAVIGGKFVLRACIVNFRTSEADIEALPEIVVRLGEVVDSKLRPAGLK